MPTTIERSAPKNALAFAGPEFQFAAEAQAEGKPPRGKISMLARSGEPIYHWYWGKVIHDMAGFVAPQRVPIDYCHDDTELLGALDKFTASNAGLLVGGEVVSFDGKDRAAEVLFRGSDEGGAMPYQSSIFFTFETLEEVMNGASVEVNGKQFTGPGLVIRKWSVRGVAVCPYGYDPNTSTQFADRLVGEIPFSFLQPENAMSVTNPTSTKPTSPAAAQAAQLSASQQPAGGTAPADAAGATELGKGGTPDPEPENPRAKLTADLKRFTDRFGAINGTKWFTEEKSFAEALELHIAEQDKQLAASRAETAAVQQKLNALNRGEVEPVTMTDGDRSTTEVKKLHASGLGENLSKFAAGITLPGKKK